MNNYTLVLPEQSNALANIYLLALAVWREARGEIFKAKLGVAWSIMNRVARPGWWGKSIFEVITKKFQYSSFLANDPNSIKFPDPDDATWKDSVKAAYAAMLSNMPDPTFGASHYHDMSMDSNKPEWAKTGIYLTSIGALRFYKAS